MNLMIVLFCFTLSFTAAYSQKNDFSKEGFLHFVDKESIRQVTGLYDRI